MAINSNNDQAHHELLLRLDERSLAMARDLATMKQDVADIKDSREAYVSRTELERRLANVVTKAAFWPVKTIVYGGAGLVLLTAGGALLALVFVHKGP